MASNKPTFRPGESNIICRDLDQTRAFYEGVLGFTFVEEEDGAVRLQCGDQYYLLLPFAREDSNYSDYMSRPRFSFDLMVDDLSATVSYLASYDVRFVQPYEPGDSNAIIRDPDGNVLEIVGG